MHKVENQTFQLFFPSGHPFCSPQIPHVLGMHAVAPLSNFLPSATKQNLAAFPFSFSTAIQPFLMLCTQASAAADTTADTQAGGALATYFRDAVVAEQSQASRLI